MPARLSPGCPVERKSVKLEAEGMRSVLTQKESLLLKVGFVW